MLNDEQIKAIKQLRDNPLFSKILNTANEKYKKAGKYSGKIRINNLTDHDKLSLYSIDKKIMERDFSEFTIQNFFKKKLLTGILKDVTDEEFWTIYNEKRIVTNIELQDTSETKKNQIFQSLLNEYDNTIAYKWLYNALESKKFGYTQIMKLYNNDQNSFMNTMKNVLSALNNYPKNKILTIPIFATEISKNPHYFDYGTIPFRLLLHGFCFFADETYPKNMEEIHLLIIKFGLVKDLVSNQILTYNISAVKNGKLHSGIEQFNAMNELLALTLKNINDYDSIIVKKGLLYVFENPSVFSTVVNRLSDKNISLVCTSGNIKLSATSFLDKALESCEAIYYSGDMDPEGLKIADYLKQRYKEKLILWRMSVDDYNASISQVHLDDKRISKLKSIKNPELIATAEVMSEKKFAGYQELILEQYISDILKTAL